MGITSWYVKLFQQFEVDNSLLVLNADCFLCCFKISIVCYCLCHEDPRGAWSQFAQLEKFSLNFSSS